MLLPPYLSILPSIPCAIIVRTPAHVLLSFRAYATVFTGVEILYQEYKHYDPWIGIGGYAVAAGVGYCVSITTAIWASDVVAGAGIGILSAKLSYLLFPYTSRILGKRKQSQPIEKAITRDLVLPLGAPHLGTYS